MALERPGVVTMVRFNEDGGADYFVNWWDEGKRIGEWLVARELNA